MSALDSISLPWEPDDLPAIDPENAFYELVRDNNEVCSHCFSRIRSCETYEDEARRVWPRSKKTHLAQREDSIAIDDGGIGYDDYRTMKLCWDVLAGEYRPGTGTVEPRVSCERCGWLGTRTTNQKRSIRSMHELVPRLCARLVWQGARYRSLEAPRGYRVEIDYRELDREIERLKSADKDRSAEESIGDTEIFATAVERSVSIEPRDPQD